MKRLAILQSNYIPWKGYFDIIRAVDEVVLYDCCQYTKNDWRNRNRIKTRDGLLWLTIPVKKRGFLSKRICDMDVVDSRWSTTHWKTLAQYYSQCPYFEQVSPVIKACYEECSCLGNLSSINFHFLETLCALLGIPFTHVWSMELCLECTDPTDRVVEICRKREADEYLSGPTAQAYLREEAFEKIDCSVRWMDYSHYLEYPQPYPPFEHGVSILDLLFNVGPDKAHDCMFDMRSHLDTISERSQEQP